MFKEVARQPSPSNRVKTILERGTQETRAKGLSLLTDLEDFVDGIKFSQYLTMRRFVGDPLESLLTFDPLVSKDAENFKEKLDAKSLLADWKSLYDKFVSLKRANTKKST